MSDRPNFLLFVADQLRSDAVGAFGNTVVQTPRLDALAARGTTFTNAFAQFPACTPSRASFMTGWYPHVAGHRTLTHLLRPHEPNLLRTLRASGYNVAWIGDRGDTFAPGVTEASTDFCGFDDPPPGPFPDATLEAPPDPRLLDAFYGGRFLETEPGADELSVRTAERWLREHPREPWVLLVSTIFPHPPFAVEEPWFSLHDRGEVGRPAPPGVGEPRFKQRIRDRYGLHRLRPDDWAEIRATYYGMVSRVDHHFGRVVDAIERAGFADRTVTAFFSDHGEYLGDYGLVEKWATGLDPCLVRDPLIVAGPAWSGGTVCDAMVELVDLLPTVLELAGVEAEHEHFGRSLVPVMEDGSRPHRDHAFSEGGWPGGSGAGGVGGIYANKVALEHDEPELLGRAIAVRSRRWSYVHRSRDTDELYDRAADPQETTNLIDDPALGSTVDELRGVLLEWLVETSDIVPRDEDPRVPEIPRGYTGNAGTASG